ncbi:MAG: DUF4914 family protein [Phycisphaerae bacterium]
MDWRLLDLTPEVVDLLSSAPSVTMATNVDQLVDLAVRDAGPDGYHDVTYDVPGKGSVLEARVCRVKNGIAANYIDAYMRRRDPDCMVIGDDKPTNKPRYKDRYGVDFAKTREETFDWLKTQDLAIFTFQAGQRAAGLNALVIAPANCGFFAMGLAMLQGILPAEDIGEGFKPGAIIYVAPPFRHTHFEGKQVVVHNRLEGMHELFSYNLYPGPSAKKGIYGVLINIGEEQGWVTAHCSTVQVVTPYDNATTIMHEGASGGGKSEMLEHVHREADGRLLLGRNLVTKEERYIVMPRTCELRPVTDDMALCHTSMQEAGATKLTLADAEDAWFVRVNHIESYGTDPHLERLTTNPPEPVLFLNIEAVPGARALIWDHIEDAPGERCPNPRVVLPRRIVPGIVNGPVTVDIRSFGVRCPPCTKEKPTYGILGLFHVLPPALGWLWRLTAPRGHANPSIVDTGGMTSEGVGSYWPFATGRRVDQANLLLKQILSTPDTLYVLCPNQHVGAWETSFMPQWVAREYLARRGSANFKPGQTVPARCPLLGWAMNTIQVEGSVIEKRFMQVETQAEVGEAAYDAGAEILFDFFKVQLNKFMVEDLLPEGRAIIEACFDGATVDDYIRLSTAAAETAAV